MPGVPVLWPLAAGSGSVLGRVNPGGAGLAAKRGSLGIASPTEQTSWGFWLDTAWMTQPAPLWLCPGPGPAKPWGEVTCLLPGTLATASMGQVCCLL